MFKLPSGSDFNCEYTQRDQSFLS